MLSESNYNFVVNPVHSTHYEDNTKSIQQIFEIFIYIYIYINLLEEIIPYKTFGLYLPLAGDPRMGPAESRPTTPPQ